MEKEHKSMTIDEIKKKLKEYYEKENKKWIEIKPLRRV